MRTITRTGVTLSIVAALGLYGVQLVAGLGVALGIVLTGALAGLAVAKWLERDWYGRQFEAGARAGAIACGVGGLSSAFYLLGAGPRSLPELAAHSQFLGIDLSPLVTALGFLGWTGVDVVVAAGATAAGVLVAALVAQIAGWSKSKRALRVVAEARLAAQALQRADGRSPTAAPRSTTLGPQLYATGAPVPAPMLPVSEWDGLGLPEASASVKKRSWRPSASTVTPRPATVHRPSDARSAKEALTDEARRALAAWSDELDVLDSGDTFPAIDELGDEDEPATSSKVRAPNHSAFLTSPPPLKPGKRKRKRQDTGDWLC
ncbi:MAG TPA: hypothetical protein VF808_04420 [Ktedonobacterales bacterium]